MQQTRQAASQEQTTSDRWAQVGNGLWLPKQRIPQAPIISPSKQKRQQHIRQASVASASQQKKQQRPSWPQRRVAGKTLWDWMSLLLIPLLVGIGTIWVTNRQTDAQNALSAQLHQSDQSQHQHDEALAQQARWDDLLKQYRDGIDTLLLSNGLRQAHPGDDVGEIAHARTLDVLNAVDAKHRDSVIAYLNNLKLIQGGFRDWKGVWHHQRVIVSLSLAYLEQAHLRWVDLKGADLVGVDLKGADLRGAYLEQTHLLGAYLAGANLRGAYLAGVDLSGAYLAGANLSRAYLRGAYLGVAYLTGADLREADLRGADLAEANLRGTYLVGVDLREADLRGADLAGADLAGANLTKTPLTSDQLHSVFSLSGTILPNGSVCEEVSDVNQFDEKRQAENRDSCLVQSEAWDKSG